MSDMTEGCCHHNACGQRGYCMINRIEELETKLAKAVEGLEYYATEPLPWDVDDGLTARTILAEIKGGNDE